MLNVCKYFLWKYKNRYKVKKVVVIKIPIDALIKGINFFVKTQTEHHNSLFKSCHNSIPSGKISISSCLLKTWMKGTVGEKLKKIENIVPKLEKIVAESIIFKYH